MLSFIDGFRSSLCENVSTTASTIKLRLSDAARLNKLKDGDHVYLSIRYLDRYEVVKFTKDADIRNGEVPVTRDMLGTGRKNFPSGTCVQTDWNSIQLKEFIKQHRS